MAQPQLAGSLKVALYRADNGLGRIVVYSWLLGNWVFVVTNALMLCTALMGQWIYPSNRQRY